MSGITSSWAIVCAGPSLNHTHDILRDPGGLICVNSSVVWCRHNLTVPDFWVMADPEVLTVCSRQVDLRSLVNNTVLWVPENYANHAENNTNGWADWSQDVHSLYKRFDILTYSTDIDLSMPFGQHIPWSGRSTFIAFAVAILNGAKRIRYYGIDMQGDDYFTSGLKNWRANLTDKRWEWEKRWFVEILKVCKKNDVEVSRG